MAPVHSEGPREDLTRLLSRLQSQIDGARLEQLPDCHHQALRMHDKTRQPSPINLQPNDDLHLVWRMLGHQQRPSHAPLRTPMPSRQRQESPGLPSTKTCVHHKAPRPPDSTPREQWIYSAIIPAAHHRQQHPNSTHTLRAPRSAKPQGWITPRASQSPNPCSPAGLPLDRPPATSSTLPQTCSAESVLLVAFLGAESAVPCIAARLLLPTVP